MTQPLDLSVVIVAHNCREHLAGCLASLIDGGLAGLTAEVIVVDNGSADGAAGEVAARWPAAHLIALPANLGFAAAANRGCAGAAGRHLWLLNPDTRVPPGTGRRLVACLDAHPACSAAGPALVDAAGVPDPRAARGCPTVATELLEQAGLPRLAERLLRLPLPPAGEPTVPLLSGAGLCVRSEAWRAAGGMDEAFFLYCEDVDLCCRLRAAGWELRFCPDAPLVHHGGGSSVACQEWAGRQAVLSKLRLFRKHRGRLAAGAYWLGVAGLSAAKLSACALAGLLPAAAGARRKRDLHRRLLGALLRGSRP